MKFSIKDFFSNLTISARNCGFGHITEEILNEKLHLLCSEIICQSQIHEKKHKINKQIPWKENYWKPWLILLNLMYMLIHAHSENFLFLMKLFLILQSKDFYIIELWKPIAFLQNSCTKLRFSFVHWFHTVVI